jgi:Tol biopolymer transport system component
MHTGGRDALRAGRYSAAMHRFKVGLLALLLLLGGSLARGAANVSLEEKPLGNAANYDAIKAVTFSTDSRHVAFLGVKEGKQFVVRDGAESPAYDWVVPGSLAGPLDLSRLGYIVQDGNDMSVVVDGAVVGHGYYAIGGDRIQFSADGKHYAYTAHRGTSDQGDAIVVRDGVAGKAYPAADIQPVFSPDGNRLLYIASPAPKKMCLVVDGKEGPQFDAIAGGSPNFSPDSKRVAYAAAAGGKVLAVIDGKAGPAYERMRMPPMFGADSNHVVYIAGNGSQYWIVLDGVEGPKFDLFTEGSVMFSPDGKHLAYAARRGKQWVLMLDGKEQRTFDAIAGESIRFSPDSEHLAYVGIAGAKRFIILDGKEASAGYPNILWPGPIFSPDSKRLAFAGTKDKQLVVVADGKEGPAYDNVADVAFSPDSKHLSYRALGKEHAMVVFDGQASVPFENTTSIAYAPDGSHWAYCASQGDKATIMMDGSDAGGTYTGWVKGARPALADAGTADFLMVKDHQFVQVTARCK